MNMLNMTDYNFSQLRNWEWFVGEEEKGGRSIGKVETLICNRKGWGGKISRMGEKWDWDWHGKLMAQKEGRSTRTLKGLSEGLPWGGRANVWSGGALCITSTKNTGAALFLKINESIPSMNLTTRLLVLGLVQRGSQLELERLLGWHPKSEISVQKHFCLVQMRVHST